MIKNYSDIFKLIGKSYTLTEQEKILELREDYLAQYEENLRLKEENIQLRRQLSNKGNLFFDGSVFWEKGDKTSPYCPHCYNDSGKQMRLQYYPKEEYTEDAWHCTLCSNYFRHTLPPN